MITDFRLPLGDIISDGIDVLTTSLRPVFDLIRVVLVTLYEAVEFLLLSPPFWVIILIAAGLAYIVKGWKFAVGTIVGLLIIVGVNQWDNAMASLALVLVASAIAIAISVPLGSVMMSPPAMVPSRMAQKVSRGIPLSWAGVISAQFRAFHRRGWGFWNW